MPWCCQHTPVLPFVAASFEVPSQWPVSPGQWRRVHVLPGLGWQLRGLAWAWCRHSSGWGCRLCSTGLQTAGGWPQEALGAPGRTGLCRRAPSSQLGYCLNVRERKKSTFQCFILVHTTTKFRLPSQNSKYSSLHASDWLFLCLCNSPASIRQLPKIAILIRETIILQNEVVHCCTTYV